MKFTRLKIPEVVLCEPKVLKDERGDFAEIFRKDKLDSFLGYKINFCQENISKSSYGVIRGLHFQMEPYAQSKLVHVIDGIVLDIALDIRIGSPTFGKHVAVELSSIKKNQLLIPRGFALGFVVLCKTAIFSYKVDNYYDQASDSGIAFDDKTLGIDWRLKPNELKLSLKDTKQPQFKDAKYFKYSKNLYE